MGGRGGVRSGCERAVSTPWREILNNGRALEMPRMEDMANISHLHTLCARRVWTNMAKLRRRINRKTRLPQERCRCQTLLKWLYPYERTHEKITLGYGLRDTVLLPALDAEKQCAQPCERTSRHFLNYDFTTLQFHPWIRWNTSRGGYNPRIHAFPVVMLAFEKYPLLPIIPYLPIILPLQASAAALVRPSFAHSNCS
jgi:hypothetical protein